MTETKPNFTHMSNDAFEWFVECYINAVSMARTSKSLMAKGIPSLGQHFQNYYGIKDEELTAEKDINKQFHIIKRKYIK